ncbi:hypothetical protein NOR_05792 [Metarhizium rileyi]|uniref:Uncharacterized protein n=1 Tax=Metarhizium rileyi (strain RCEF 4871) TaxID=1649241 RepID=A0A167C2K3_METRR|nr:hypothetical protein NOR_05792 [Metarhizium rileyi RCEF 4871]
MHPLFLLNCILAIVTRAHGAPRPDLIATICPESIASSSRWSGSPTSATLAPPSADDCAPGGACDCSRIPDKQSDVYFQCVTNPNCERCWVGKSTVSTLSPKLPVANVTSMDYRTMSPGTYTITANGTVLNVVVTQEIATPLSTEVFVTMTETVVVTVQPAGDTAKEPQAPTITASKSSLTSALEGSCSSRCDCSRVEDKESKEFFECLTDPDCEKCLSTTVEGSVAATSASSFMTTTTASRATTTTSSPAKPMDTCPQFCDCSSIEDKASEDYFQCITNPICERCNTGGAKQA